MKEKTAEFWLKVAETIAKERFDGHYTLMRFTTNWRFGFGTVNDRADIEKMVPGKTLTDAVRLGVMIEKFEEMNSEDIEKLFFKDGK